MRIERTRNATKGIAAGLLLKAYQILLPFLMRTAMIHFMGVQYLGLNSLFTSILHVLNLAELGVGNAMVFSMYKPIAEDDEKTICALMRLYRRYYRYIGLFIGAAGVLLTPVVPHLISGEIPPELNIYVLYYLNLGATVLTYWLFAYKNCLLHAHQRTDLVSLVTVFTTTLQYGVQLLILLWYKDYYLYVVALLATTALNNVLTAYVAAKKYPRYSPKGELDREEVRRINGKIRDLFTGKLGYVVLKSADTIVISAFLGLTVLAVYQNYFFILSSVSGAVEIIFSSIMAGLGNSIVVESKKKNYLDLEKFTFLFMWLTGLCTCCFLGLYQPFMEIWVGRELMLGFAAVICLAVYFYVYSLNRLLNVYKDAAGLWRQDRFRPLITALVNLSLNLLWVNEWGVYGVLLSTAVSMIVVGMPWLLHNLFSLLFDRALLSGYIRQLFVYIAATVAAGVIVCAICAQISLSGWGLLFACMAVSVAVPNVLYLALLHKRPQFRPSIRFIDQMTGNRLSLERRMFGCG